MMTTVTMTMTVMRGWVGKLIRKLNLNGLLYGNSEFDDTHYQRDDVSRHMS